MSELEREAARLAAERDRTLGKDARKAHGVVHTSPELARFTIRELARAVSALDREVTIVDPACGPGAFLAAAIASGIRARAIVGIDRDERAIEQARALLGSSARLAVADTLASLDPLLAHERGAIAIVGNPPWAGRSANRGAPLMEALLADFREGVRGERKIGVLSDAYVRFWRWSCELARRSDGAVVALITNASFLDGPVHRGMRAALARWFAHIDVFDLGGSSLVARAEGADENLFGVRPGAALTIAIRPPAHDETRVCTLRHAQVRGTREEKLARLEVGLSLGAIDPHGPWTARAEVPPVYASWVSIAGVFPFHREGVQTNRDAFATDEDRDALIARLRAFADGGPGPDVPSEHYDPARARASIRAALFLDPELRHEVVRVAYRPLEPRWAVLLPAVCHRPRPDLLAAMRRSSLALVTVRKDRGQRPWTHFAAVRDPVDNCFLSARSSCRARAFPTHDPDGRPNVDPGALGISDPADAVRYALAILASPRYRAACDAALRADYPRIPRPSPEVLASCVEAGEALAGAFEDPREGVAVIGHHTVKNGGALNEAIERAARATEPVLCDLLP